MTFRQIGDVAVCNPLKRVALLMFALLFFVSVTAFAIPPMMYDVTIYDGENVIVYKTALQDGESVLKSAGVEINEEKGDRVSFKNFDGEDGSAIFITRGVKVTVQNFDGLVKEVYSSGTVADAVEKSGFSPKENSAFNYSEDEFLSEGMYIKIYDVFTVTVKADGKKVKKTVSGETVADALSVLGYELGEEDYTKPEITEILKDGMTISVYRVATKSRTEKEAIPYETEYTYTDSLSKNTERTLQKGKNGEKEVVYEDVYVNGKLQTSEVKTEKVLAEATNALVQVGTKVQYVPKTLPIGTPISEMAVPSYINVGKDGIPTNYKSVINAKATAYCIPGGTTSTGKRAQTGYVAVDPKEIPYGTEMYIVSADGKYVYGYCIAADTGSYIYDVDWTIDLFMNSESQCVQWGRRDIIVYVF
ncbi:MAG: G5 domain-containing protein [Acutalibacteraceae bacterium]